MTEHPPDDADRTQPEDAEENVAEAAATVERDVLTGAPPNAEEIQRADPDREGDETDPYELRSGIQDSPSDSDPGSMLNR